MLQAAPLELASVPLKVPHSGENIANVLSPAWIYDISLFTIYNC